MREGQEERKVSRRRFLQTTGGAAAGLGALSLGVIGAEFPASAQAVPTRNDYLSYARAGAAALQGWYDSASGLWDTTGWWQSGNNLTTIAEYTQWTGDRTYVADIANTFTAAQKTHVNFENFFYDDSGWWALGWVAAYDVTRDPTYLDMARTIFTFISGGWDPSTCGGGVWWSLAKSYKNAIANELFLSLAAALHLRTPGDRGEGSYLDWALKEWEWFKASGMINSNGLVNDGLNSSCSNNGGTTWTYNQGVILGGLAALFRSTGDPSYLEQGQVIADAAIHALTDANGILVEPCGTNGCDSDQVRFKGIFVRNLYAFYRVSLRPAYRDFILRNAASIWASDRNPANQFGLSWAGPFDTADATRQGSALDALNSAVGLFGPAL